MGTLVEKTQILAGDTNLGGRPNQMNMRTHTSTGPPELDCRTWANLQPELVARILAFLPLTALIHTRLVCQKWDRAIYSGRILGAPLTDLLGSKQAVKPDARSWLFLFENLKLHAFDPARDDWQTLPTLPQFVTARLCGAAGGLMVCAMSAPKSQFVRYFGVFNPVTRSWKKLPPLLTRRQQPVVAMFMDSRRGYNSYKVVVAGGMADRDERVLTTEVYDSKSESWRVTSQKFLNNQVASHVCEEMRTSTAFCDGTVYHMRFNQRLSFDPRRENHTFMVYDTKATRWRPLRVPLPPDLVFTEYPSLKRVWQGRVHVTDVLPPVLVESNKRLLLIGFREEDRSASRVASVGIWELVLGRTTKGWRSMSVMPDALFQQVLCPVVRDVATDPASSYLQYELQGAAHGALVYVFRPAGGVLVCDLAQTPPTWRSIRESAIGGDSLQSLQGCVMDLRLDTVL